MAKGQQETALAVPLASRFPVLIEEHREQAIAAIRENLGGQQLSPFSLDVMKVPTGGLELWTIPGLNEGESENAKELRGIVVHHRPARAFWAARYGEGDNGAGPPDCFSEDGVTGVGSPGGDCMACPFNVWGTKDAGNGQHGRGKACQQRHLLFLLREGEAIPCVVNVPPSSLKAVQQYLLRLASRMLPCYTLETVLKLVKTKNAGNIAYSEITVSAGERLPGDQHAGIRAYREAIMPALDRVQVMDAPPDATTVAAQA